MNNSERVQIDNARVENLVVLLSSQKVPVEQESKEDLFKWPRDLDELANCYLAIVAICHQTSPIGERRLEGSLLGKRIPGWDYLRGKFLWSAIGDRKWTSPEYWQRVTPTALSDLFIDPEYGLTLNRIAERSFLLNDLGRRLLGVGSNSIRIVFENCDQMISGANGFIALLQQFEAYRDPLNKKGFFFLSIAKTECGWTPKDIDRLLSPIDYHELRGHLRLGTIAIKDTALSAKVSQGLALDLSEDFAIRVAAQGVNNTISEETGISNSAIHYLFWNVFRNCCPRNPNTPHCSACPSTCSLPKQYKGMMSYQGHCIFADVCKSASSSTRPDEPPFIGHYY